MCYWWEGRGGERTGGGGRERAEGASGQRAGGGGRAGDQGGEGRGNWLVHRSLTTRRCLREV